MYKKRARYDINHNINKDLLMVFLFARLTYANISYLSVRGVALWTVYFDRANSICHCQCLKRGKRLFMNSYWDILKTDEVA